MHLDKIIIKIYNIILLLYNKYLKNIARLNVLHAK